MSEKYFNEFDDLTSEYVEVRAIPGRAAQTREENEIQAMQWSQRKRGFDSLYRNGYVVEGGAYVRSLLTPNVLTLKQAKIYYNGYFLTVPEASITLTGSESTTPEIIGVAVTESVVTWVTDPSLRDPAAGYPNGGKIGANRKKLEARWVKDAVGAAPIYKFIQGVPVEDRTDADLIPAQRLVAEAVNDLAGSFVVSGFELLRVKNSTTTQMLLEIGEGRGTSDGSKAWVQGNPIAKVLTEPVMIPKATVTRAVASESSRYSPEDPESPTDAELRFRLNSQPLAAKPTQVRAIFEVTRTITSHTPNGADPFPLEDNETMEALVSIAGFVQGAGSSSTTGDYWLDDNNIRWNTAKTPNSEPAGVYTVTAQVARILGADEYTTYVDSNGDGYLDISPLDGTWPAPEENLLVDYTYYLPRYDVVYVRPNGTFGVAPGAPDRAPQLPQSVPVDALALGHLYVGAVGDLSKAPDAVVITPYDVKRKTQLRLGAILRRLENAEYNLAALALQDQAVKRAGSDAATLRSIFTDAMVYTADELLNGTAKFDVSPMNGAALTDAGMLHAGLRELGLPEFALNNGQTYPLVPVVGSGTTAKIFAKSFSLGFNFNAGLPGGSGSNLYTAGLPAQLQATGTKLVNEYAVSKRTPAVALFPNTFRMVETVDSFLQLDGETQKPTDGLAKRLKVDTASAEAVNQALNNAKFVETATNYAHPDLWIKVKVTDFQHDTYISAMIDDQRITPVALSSEDVTELGLTAASTISNGHVLVNGAGVAGFKFRIGAVTGGKVPVGSRTITVTSQSGETGAAALTGGLEREVSGVGKIVGELIQAIAPPPPRLLTAVPNVTDTTAPTAITWTVTLDPTSSGVATHVQVRTQPSGTTYDGVKNATGLVWTVTGPTALDEALRYEVVAIGPGGPSSTIEGAITRSGAQPVVNKPTLTSFGLISPAVIPAGARFSVDAVFGWETSGTVTGIEIKHVKRNYSGCARPGHHPSCNSTAVAEAHTFTETDGNTFAKGTMKLTLYPGVNTVSIKITGPAGSEIQHLVSSVSELNIDPIAQTVVITAPAYIKGVSAYFATKPSSTDDPDGAYNVRCEIRNVVNGFPGPVVLQKRLASSTKKPADVNTSPDASVATYFEFEEPIYLEGSSELPGEYAVVFVTESGDYAVYVAEVGQNKVGTTDKLTSQAYPNGVLFTSSNNIAWSPHQGTDLKFQLHGVAFQTLTSTVEFALVSVANITAFYLSSSNQFSPSSQDCNIRWEYQVNANGTWRNFEPNGHVDLDELASTIQMRATLIGTPAMTPRLGRDGLELRLLSKKPVGNYVTKAIVHDEAFRYVRVFGKMYVPAGTNIKWYVNVDDALDDSDEFVWTEITSVGEIRTLLDDQTFYEHERTLDLGEDLLRRRLRVKVRIAVDEGGDVNARLVKNPRFKDLIAIATG